MPRSKRKRSGKSERVADDGAADRVAELERENRRLTKKIDALKRGREKYREYAKETDILLNVGKGLGGAAAAAGVDFLMQYQHDQTAKEVTAGDIDGVVKALREGKSTADNALITILETTIKKLETRIALMGAEGRYTVLGEKIAALERHMASVNNVFTELLTDETVADYRPQFERALGKYKTAIQDFKAAVDAVNAR